MRKAIAIDFDGCLCDEAYPDIGAPHWDVINRAIAEQQAGAGLILWTIREGELLRAAVDACAEWGLHFDAVNESLEDWIAFYGTCPRKVGASEYWDDRAVQMPTTSKQGKKTRRNKDTRSQKGRKYFRKCGVCGIRYEQSEMVRDGGSPNGWICHDCKADCR